MRTIRAKMLAAFIIIIVTLIQVAYFLYHSSQLYINNYDEILRRFLLLNEITQKTREVSKTISLQLGSPSQAYVNDFARLRQDLINDQRKLDQYFNEPNNQLAVKNYKNIISSYLETAEELVEAKEAENTARYAEMYPDLENLRRYLQEYAQSLYDIELTNYHEFYSQTVSKNEALRELSTLMIIFTAGLSILFVVWFSTGISRPITHLAKAAKQSYLRDGVFHFQPVQVSSRDEVEILADSFNTMGYNIQRMVQEMNRKAELEIQLQKQEVENLEINNLLKEMELKALQNQIQPHFLFNTLNVISKLAYLEGAERSSELMLSLSSMLRYNLRRMDVLVSLEEELSHVRQYFHIQKTRFGDRVTLGCEADPALLSVQMPCLTIQPLVENAFIHGIESYEEGAEIRLSVYTRMANGQQQVVVEIRDNGVGMTEDTLQRLRRLEQARSAGAKSAGHSTGIGLQNVCKRLMLHAKTERLEDVIHIESKPGEGTTVQVFLPLLIGGESCVLQADSGGRRAD
jgi:sensor histidine kinase YesM